MTLTPPERAFLVEARRATLATIDPAGLPRLVPICFVLADDDILYSPLDEKPKAVADPRALARVRDILARPEVAILVDRWSEDWAELAWLRALGRATLLEPDAVPAGVVESLRAKYPQYAVHGLEARPLLRVDFVRVVTWGRLPPA